MALAILAIAWPAPAQGAAASSTGAQTRYEAAPGEMNEVTVLNLVTLSGLVSTSVYRFQDSGATIEPAPPCVPVPVETPLYQADVLCPASPTVVHLVRVGDEDDSVFISAPDVSARLEGGSGDDSLSVRSGPSTLLGEDGNDRLVGGTGSDRFNGARGDDLISSRDGLGERISCGIGIDRVTADAADLIATDCEFVSTA